MGDNSPLTDADVRASRFAAMAGDGVGGGGSDPTAVIERLLAAMTRIEQKLEALEAELLRPHPSQKCPRCQRLSLTVSETRPHPEFGNEGIEEHDVLCGCGYSGSRLYDPRDFLR